MTDRGRRALRRRRVGYSLGRGTGQAVGLTRVACRSVDGNGSSAYGRSAVFGVRRRLTGSVLALSALALVGVLPADAQAQGQAHPVTWSELLSAPVPRLCGHPAGRLVHGSLPGIPRGRGEVTILPWASAKPTRRNVVFGDLNGDGVTDAAVVVTCDQGGVPWPESVQLYTSGDRRLGGAVLSSISHGDRDGVVSMKLSKGLVDVHWQTNRRSDYGCCSTMDYAADLSVLHGRVAVTHPTPYDERPALHALLAAVKTGSAARVQRLATAAVATTLLARQQEGLLSSSWRCFGDPSVDHTWPTGWLGALSGPNGTASWSQPGSRYCVTFQPQQQVVTMVRLTHLGYRKWTADYALSGD